MSKHIQLKQILSNKHWGSWAKGYLKLAEQGFLYLNNQKNIGRKKLFQEKEPIYSLENGHLIIASIWNIKHGLELIIKALGINLDRKYWIKHNLEYLLNDLDQRIKNFCIKRRAKYLGLRT